MMATLVWIFDFQGNYFISVCPFLLPWSNYGFWISKQICKQQHNVGENSIATPTPPVRCFQLWPACVVNLAPTIKPRPSFMDLPCQCCFFFLFSRFQGSFVFFGLLKHGDWQIASGRIYPSFTEATCVGWDVHPHRGIHWGKEAYLSTCSAINAFPGQQVGWICCNKLMWSWCGRLWLVAFHVDGYIRIWWPQIPQINTCPNGFTKIDWKDRCFACLQTVLPFCGLELLQLLTTAYNRDGTCKFRVLTKHKVSGVKYVPKNCCKNNQSFSRVIYNSIARKSYTKQQILTT